MALFDRKTAEERDAEKQAHKQKKEDEKIKRHDTLYRHFPKLFKPLPPDRPLIDSMKYREADAFAVLPVKKVYSMGGRSKVITGIVKKGIIQVGDEVYVASNFEVVDKCKIVDIAQLNKHFNWAPENASIQVTLDASNVLVRKGDVLFVKEE